jgi:hypothetical protein
MAQNQLRESSLPFSNSLDVSAKTINCESTEDYYGKQESN